MRKGVLHHFFKKSVIVLIAIALVLTGVFFTEANGSIALASEEGTAVKTNNDGYYVKSFSATEFKEYRQADGNHTYPKLTASDGADYQDWLFAGWFTNEECTTALESSVTSTSDNVYAKFVDADLSYIKCQVTPDTYANSEKTDMRLISALESDDYSGAGFLVTYKGNEPLDCPSTSIYARLSATDDGMQCGYSPAAFNADGKYFSAVRLLNIAGKNFDAPFYIQSYWVTLDGTTVLGMNRYVRVEDSYNKIVNVPIRVYDDAKVTSGSVSVSYDSDRFSLYTTEEYTTGYDAGNVFDTVSIKTDTAGTIVINGSSTESVSADGIIANLRLQLKEGAGLESNTIFGVGNESFTGDVTTLDVSDVTFKNYPLAYSGGYDTSWYDGFNDEDVEVYVINSAADLYGLAHIVNDTTGTYKDEVFAKDTIILGADMSINEGTAESMGWTAAEGATEYLWTPIGGSSVCFKGVFNGNGNTIQGIVLKDTDAVGYAGLFGQASGTIKNFSITNSYVESTGGRVGSVAGYLTGNLDTVYSKAIVVNSADTDNSGEFETGGLIGRYAADGEKKISNCWFEGAVSSTNRACGGLVGGVTSGEITVEYCLNSGTVTNDMDGGAHTGGLFGRVQAEDNKTVNLHLDNLLNKGIVNTLKFTNGSVIGYMNDSTVTIVDTYATNESYQNPNEVVTSIGWKEGATLNGSVELCVEEDITGYTSYNTIAALDYCTYNNPNGFWVVRDDGVPALKSFTDNWIDVEWFYDADEEGYVIRTAEALYGFSAIGQDTSFYGKTVKLGADIELNKGVAEKWGNVAPARAWKAIGRTEEAHFQGTFDGQGHTISGMYLKESTAYQGMFGRATITSVIQNFELVNSYFRIDGADIYGIGSIVGQSYGMVKSIYSDAYVVAYSTDTTTKNCLQAGGIVGRACGNMTTDYVPTTTAVIDDCWFNGEVILKGTTREGGGIVGRVTAGAVDISNCLFTGSVSSERADDLRVGGIMAIQNSYSVINITNCLSDGELDVDAYTNVGSVVGRIRDTYAADTGIPRSSYTMLGVYATEECSMDSTGAVQKAYNCKTEDEPNGGVEVYARADIQDEKGFTLTGLDFTDYWVAKNDSTPELKTFSTDGIDVPSMQPYTGWYNPKESEFVITTVRELYGFAKLVVTNTFEGQIVKLGADIEINDKTTWGDAANWSDDANKPENVWTPIGYTADKTAAFKGTFDGQGKTIAGLYMNGSINTGLFDVLDGATIKNLRLENSHLESSVAYNGGIASCAKNITFDTIYCGVNIRKDTGGGESHIGGFVGTVDGGINTISNCWFDGSVYSNYPYYTGMIGSAAKNVTTNDITVDNCLITGDIICARAAGSVSNAAAFCGRIRYNTNLSIMNSLVACEIRHVTNSNATPTPIKQAAAIVGLQDGASSVLEISNTYAINEVLLERDIKLNTPAGDKNVAKYSYGTKSGEAIFLDKSTIMGDGAFQMTRLDFNYWVAKEGTLPVPRSLSEGDNIPTPGTQPYTGWYEPNNADKTGYVISTVAELYGVSALSADGYDFAGQKITLGADIIINNKETHGDAENWGNADYDKADELYKWTPIKTFAGEFDGADYTISGMYVNNTTANGSGLFGTTKSGSYIHNLRLENSYIYSTRQQIGSVAGCGIGTFKTIYSDTIINATNYYVGGIVGYINSGSENSIENCWYDGGITLTGSSGWEAGGIVGYVQNDGNTVTINNCLNSADISCEKNDAKNSVIGGICGSSYQGNVDVKSCLNVGEITVAVKGGTGTIIGSVRGDKNATASITYTYSIDLGDSVSELDSHSGVGEFIGQTNGEVTGAASLLDSETLLYGDLAKDNAEDLFDENITTAWTTVDGAVPVLKSFEDYTVPGAKIVSNGVVKKTIIYTNDEYATIATNLQAKLKELTGFDFEIQTSVSADTVENSIVIGKIYTEECMNLYGYISGVDSALASVGSNIYLCGTNTTTLQSASDALVSGIVVTEIGGTIDESTGELTGAKVYATVPSDLFTIENDTTASEYRLLGTSLAKYSIVIDDEASELSQLMAKHFQEQVFAKTNIYLEIVTDATDSCGYDIVFGDTARTASSSVYTDGTYNNTDYGYSIVNVDNNIAVGYTDSTALLSAYDKLIALFSEDTSTGINLIGTDETVTKVVKADSSYIRVMSSNIYTQNGTDFNESLGDKMPSWKVRAEIVAEVYRTYKPDFFGLQEASFDQQDEILKYIDDLYAKVEFTGTSKNQTPIFYRKDLYQVEDQKYYDFGSGRHYEWALYSSIEDSTEQFIHMNLHYSPIASEQAPYATIVNNEIKRLTALYPGVAIAVTGDYNSKATSDTYTTMVAGTSLASGAALVANDYSDTYTCHSLGVQTVTTGGPIDIVSITTDLLEAKDYKVIYDPIVCWGSDHYPVFLDVVRK